MRRKTLITTALGGLALAALGGAGAFYSGLVPAGNSACAPARAAAARMAPLAKGEVAALEIFNSPVQAPALAFTGPEGQPLTLADFAGRTVLVNLWATWCAPCLKEMPSLDRLQSEMGGKDFEVVAINIDTRHLEKPRKWLKEANVTRLAYYADPQAGVFQSLRTARKVEGMPVSLLVDGRGCELGLIQGPADWASPDAKALIAAALGR